MRAVHPASEGAGLGPKSDFHFRDTTNTNPGLPPTGVRKEFAREGSVMASKCL